MEEMAAKGIDLYDFLVEAELQHYYTAIKSELKVQTVSQLKYATDEDLRLMGWSRPEIRRLRKFYDRHYPNGYLSKIKRLLQAPKKDDSGQLSTVSEERSGSVRSSTISNGGNTAPPGSKHIIPAESISVHKQLGIGEFGVVQQGVWRNNGDRIQVAIKCLSRERMQSHPMEFLKEAAIMHAVDSPHIVRLYGVVLDTDALMLVTELAPLRSLLECLKEPALRSSFTILTLCEFASQICMGMNYLENKRLIHRDLAARNILVFSKYKVKISDFGLSRALGVGKDYYQTNFNVNLKLPIAWCAPECISYLRFTSLSDVWAYAVTLWEMFSYGFQPWAALTGHQILEAIDEPNYQRLEQPECCPKEYYSLMLKCWQHEPLKRPNFSEIQTLLPDCKPEQVQAIVSSAMADAQDTRSRERIPYRAGDVITVLDKVSHAPLWRGVLDSGRAGLFEPAHTVTYVGALPGSGSGGAQTTGGSHGAGGTQPAHPPQPREVFHRTPLDRGSKRRLRTEMISSPQGDLKHTGHVGLDGAYFGDIAFLRGNDNNAVPRQIVAPYKPSEDLEAPLLPPTPTTLEPPDTPLGVNSTSSSSNSSGRIRPVPNLNLNLNLDLRKDFPDFGASDSSRKVKWCDDSQPDFNGGEPHEYHEISDDENVVAESPRFDKSFDLGPSLLDEMESMFRSLGSPKPPPSPADHEGANQRNEIMELSNRLNRTASTGKKKQASVKPISASDERALDCAIALANEISARSMTDLETNEPPRTPGSPSRRKFSFRFPGVPMGQSHGHGHHQHHHAAAERTNFYQEAQSIPDLQRLRTSMSSLDSASSLRSDLPMDTTLRLPLWDRASAEFCFAKSRELLSKPILPYSSNYPVTPNDDFFRNSPPPPSTGNVPGKKLNYPSAHFMNAPPYEYQPRKPTITRANSERTKRHPYENDFRTNNNTNRVQELYPAPRSDGFQRKKYTNDNKNNAFHYHNHHHSQDGAGVNNQSNITNQMRPRTASLTSETQHKRRSIRARNLRRQSSNLAASFRAATSSSSASDLLSSSTSSSSSDSEMLSRSGSLRSRRYHRPNSLRRPGSAASLFSAGHSFRHAGGGGMKKDRNTPGFLRPNFDVSKLTGKSPPAAQQEKASSAGATSNDEYNNTFRWPPVLLEVKPGVAVRLPDNWLKQSPSHQQQQSTITEETRLAYTSLIEQPVTSATVQRCLSPRNVQQCLQQVATTTQSVGINTQQQSAICTPMISGPPMERAPTINASQDDLGHGPDDTNPLRILRSKNFPAVRPRLRYPEKLRPLPNVRRHVDDVSGEDGGVPESPSYVTGNADFNTGTGNNGFSYPDTTNNATLNGSNEDSANNPVPLPPRDRTLSARDTLRNAKRHTRKHPLIILPASSTLQRTLDKVNQITPVEDKPVVTFPQVQQVLPTRQVSPCYVNQQDVVDYQRNMDTKKKKEFLENNFTKQELQHVQYENIAAENDDDKSKSTEQVCLRTSLQHNSQDVDRASVDFENMVESDFNETDDAFCEPGETPDQTEDSTNPPETTNTSSVTALVRPRLVSADAVDSVTIPGGAPLAGGGSHDVSCEDLLEFAGRKPPGRARGVESDEVRIMSKVLGREISPEVCLLTLDFIDWDVHRAIKLARLQRVLGSGPGLSLGECKSALEVSQWDVTRAARYISTDSTSV